MDRGGVLVPVDFPHPAGGCVTLLLAALGFAGVVGNVGFPHPAGGFETPAELEDAYAVDVGLPHPGGGLVTLTEAFVGGLPATAMLAVLLGCA